MSGAAKRRRRRVNRLIAEREAWQNAMNQGGDIIDTASSALQAVVMLACGAPQQLEIKGDELATLLDLIHNEFIVGRAVQCGSVDAVVIE